jgi:hypothetical protein
MNYFASVSSSLYHAGYTEDGEENIGEIFSVCIENEVGRRFCHTTGFSNDEALAKAERLADRMNKALAAGTAPDFTFWREIDPAYGSEEYQRQGIEAEQAELDKQAA